MAQTLPQATATSTTRQGPGCPRIDAADASDRRRRRSVGPGEVPIPRGESKTALHTHARVRPVVYRILTDQFSRYRENTGKNAKE